MKSVYQVVEVDENGIETKWDTFKDLADAFEQVESQIMLVVVDPRDTFKIFWHYASDGSYEAWFEIDESVTLTKWRVNQIEVH